MSLINGKRESRVSCWKLNISKKDYPHLGIPKIAHINSPWLIYEALVDDFYSLVTMYKPLMFISLLSSEAHLVIFFNFFKYRLCIP